MPPRFAWHDRDPLSVRRAGGTVEFEEAEVALTAASAEQYFAENTAVHPLSVLTRPWLEQAGTYDAVCRQMLAVLREGNEDPSAFRVTSRYRIAQLVKR